MLGVNLWLAIRDDAQQALNERLNWNLKEQGIYTGPVPDRAARLFKRMHDRTRVQRLFRTDNVGGRTWTLWSIYLFYNINILSNVQNELDFLVATYPNQLQIVGAWFMDGRQVGTQWADEEHLTTSGSPIYPIHSRILEIMPDIDEVGTRPTEPSDINLLMGQSPRRFV